MQIGKLSAGILNMKIDTFDSRTTPSEGTIPGLALGAGNPLGLVSGGKSKSAKKKSKEQAKKQKNSTNTQINTQTGGRTNERTNE